MSCVAVLRTLTPTPTPTPTPKPTPDPVRAVAESAAVLRLFHALGGSAAWFRVRVGPVVAQWQSLLTECARAPGARAILDGVLIRAALAAEAETAAAPRPPEQRLAAAHRAGWVAIHALRARAAPDSGSRSADPSAAERWGDAATCLVRSGRWSVMARPGRWRRLDKHPALLWPLAGHDLRALVLPPPTLAQVVEGLAMAGYLPERNSASALRFGRRADGRILTVLPVGPTLLARLGIDAGLATAGSLEPLPPGFPGGGERRQERADA